jgi:putative acetyltransferase
LSQPRPGAVVFLHGLESPIGPDGQPCGLKARFLRRELDAATPNLDTRVAVAGARRLIEQGLPWRHPVPGYEEGFATPLANARAALEGAEAVVASSFGGAVWQRLLMEHGLALPSVVLAGAGPKLTPHRTLPPRLRTLLIHGLRDDVVPVADSIALFRSSPDAALLLLDDEHGLPTAVGPGLLRGVAWCLGQEPVGHPVAGVALRPEAPGDEISLRRIHRDAFPDGGEAGLVDALRRSSDVVLSQVAELHGRVVAHALYVRVHIDGRPGVGLAPLAVHPEAQGRRIGAAVAMAGLDACRSAGERFAVVLGDPGYYERLGFAPAHRFGIACEYEVPPGVFRVQPLEDGGLTDVRGLARYPALFASL